MEKMNDLKIIRYQHGGITAKEAAKKIGMTYQNYLAIECGRRKGSGAKGILPVQRLPS